MPDERSERRPLTREEVLEHALRALIHAAPEDVLTDAMCLCTDHPGHSVLAGRAAAEIDFWWGSDLEDLDFAAGLPRGRQSGEEPQDA